MLAIRDRATAAADEVYDRPEIQRALDELRGMSVHANTLGSTAVLWAVDGGYLRGLIDGVHLAGLLPAGETEFAARLLIALGGFKPMDSLRARLGMSPSTDDENPGGTVNNRQAPLSICPDCGTALTAEAISLESASPDRLVLICGKCQTVVALTLSGQAAAK